MADCSVAVVLQAPLNQRSNGIDDQITRRQVLPVTGILNRWLLAARPRGGLGAGIPTVIVSLIVVGSTTVFVARLEFIIPEISVGSGFDTTFIVTGLVGFRLAVIVFTVGSGFDTTFIVTGLVGFRLAVIIFTVGRRFASPAVLPASVAMLGVSVFLCLGVPCPGTIVAGDLPLIGGMAMLVFAGGFSVAVNVGTTGVTAVVETAFRGILGRSRRWRGQQHQRGGRSDCDQSE